MVSNSDFQKAVELIGKSSSILLTTHTKPDGDACGSLAAMADVLVALGKTVEVIFPSPLPEWYEFLFAEKPLILGSDVTVQQLIEKQAGEFDLIILIDVNTYNQLPEIAEFLKQNDKPVLVIDHHETGDGLGDVELVDSTAAATGLIIFDLLKYAKWQINEKAAQAIFVAIAADTGWFQFSNTDSRVHQAGAELIERGVNPTIVYRDLYQKFSPERFKLMTAMLNTLELHFDGRFATQYLLQSDFERTGAAYKDTENLIDECRRIGTVEVAALFVELADGRIKCSLRSRSRVDVCKIAARFGGGGHKMAAGVHLPGPVENAKRLIYEKVKEQFAQLESQ